MTDMSPGWHPDPSATDQLRWWDGAEWTDDIQTAPSPPPSARATPRPATSDDDGPRFPEPSDPKRPQRVLWAVLGLGVVLLLLALGVTVMASSSSDDPSTAAPPATDASPAPTPATDPETSSTTVSTGPATVTGDRVFTESTGRYRITAGPDWQLASSGLTETPLWTIGPSGDAFVDNVNIVAGTTIEGTTADELAQQTAAGIEAVDGLTVTSTTATQLDDGTPAVLIGTDYVVNGVTIRQQLLVAVRGATAVTVTVSSRPETATATFASVDPYLRSLEIL